MRLSGAGRLGALAALSLAAGGWAAAVPFAAPEPAAVPEPPAVIAWTTALGEVVFPHQMHVEDLGIECEGCHHETSAARLTMPHPGYFEDFWIDCASCHGHQASPGQPKACSVCHPSTPAGVADETSSSKVVIHRSCWVCHEVATGQEASRSCVTCHPDFAAVPPDDRAGASLSGSGKGVGR